MKTKRKSEFASIKDIMQDVMKENKLQKGMDLVAIKEAWVEVMGNGVNSYTKDIQFKNGTLLVKLTSSVLREELSYGKDKIIQLLNENLHKTLIKSVKLQ